MKKKVILAAALLVVLCFAFAGCEGVKVSATVSDRTATKEIAATLAERQPTPTDMQ